MLVLGTVKYVLVLCRSCNKWERVSEYVCDKYLQFQKYQKKTNMHEILKTK